MTTTTIRREAAVPDFRVADTASEHRKLRRAGLLGAGLWSMAGSWAMAQLTDGWVPDYWVQTWPNAKVAVKALVDAGLWSPETVDGIPGFRFHDWLTIQRSASEIHTEREKGRERARKSRERSGERSAERAPERRRERGANVRGESHDSLSLTRALTPGSTSGEGISGSERADPRPRCPEHASWPPDQRIPACGRCADLRRTAEQHSADQAEHAAAARATRRAAVDACPTCDDAGMRELDTGALTRCDHDIPAAGS